MDPVSIAPLVMSAWGFILPYAKKIANKLIEKTEEDLPDLIGSIWDTVKAKMETHPETNTLPVELVTAPDDQIVQGAFQYQLKKLLENDALFAQQLEKLVLDANNSAQSNKALLNGDGTIAQGSGATAIGKRGIQIAGNASDNIIITGDKNTIKGEKSKKRN